MLHRMKVTALIADQLVYEVKKKAKGKNLTDCIVIALREWLAMQKLRELNNSLQKNPLKFRASFSAEKVRALNRKLT